MIAKTIKYKDYNGVEREDKFYFNLSKAEVTEMELSTQGGLADKIKTIIEANDTPEIIKTFKELILASYGEKTADGKRFRKVDDQGRKLSIAFSETEAYSNLFVELANDDVKAAEFVNGIMPVDLSKEELDKEVAKLQAANATDQQTNN